MSLIVKSVTQPQITMSLIVKPAPQPQIILSLRVSDCESFCINGKIWPGISKEISKI